MLERCITVQYKANGATINISKSELDSKYWLSLLTASGGSDSQPYGFIDIETLRDLHKQIGELLHAN